MSTENPPVFPLTFLPENVPGIPTGICLRDYFAAHIVAGLIASPRVTTDNDTGKVVEDEDGFAKTAYTIADAMLKARK